MDEMVDQRRLEEERNRLEEERRRAEEERRYAEEWRRRAEEEARGAIPGGGQPSGAPQPFTTPRTDPLSSGTGWPVGSPPTQQQLDNVWSGTNSSSGNFPAASMPTFANNPAPMGSNAIPVGDIPGRTAAGLLGSHNAPNYIQGLLGKYNPGNWQGGMADVLSRSTPQATPLLDRRRSGNASANPFAPTALAAGDPGALAPAPPADGTGPDGTAWNLTNGGVITGYRRDYTPVFGPPGSPASQAFV